MNYSSRREDLINDLKQSSALCIKGRWYRYQPDGPKAVYSRDFDDVGLNPGWVVYYNKENMTCPSSSSSVTGFRKIKRELITAQDIKWFETQFSTSSNNNIEFYIEIDEGITSATARIIAIIWP